MFLALPSHTGSKIMLLFAFTSLLFTNCSKPVTVNSGSVVTGNTFRSSANTNSANTNTSSTEVALNSPTEAATAHDRAVSKRDATLLKRTLSQGQLKEFQKLGDEDRKSLDDAIKDYFKTLDSIDPSKETANTPLVLRNEIINGNSATVEEKLPYFWMVLKFKKENGEWKYDGTAGAVENYRKEHPDYKTVS